MLRSCKTDVRCGILVGKGTIFIPRRSEALGLGLTNCCLLKSALLIIAEKILARNDIVKTRTLLLEYWNLLEPVLSLLP